MRLTFHGAAREVTGSCYLLEGAGKRVLVDRGLIQGRGEERNREPLPFDPATLDGVYLTHAHLDHSGLIPLLVREGFRGPVFATLPTVELCEVLWLDTAKIAREETERLNRRNHRSGRPIVEPLYGEEDVRKAIELFEPISYDEPVRLGGVETTFRNAAHILGAAALEVRIQDQKVVFSGDMGSFNGIMEGSPPIIDDADYVVVESTYGNRAHRGVEETRVEFGEAIGQALESGGKVLIPSFVVDRAQRVLYELFLFQRKDGLDCPVFFDSPMGKLATDIYRKYRDFLAGEIRKTRLSDTDPFSLPSLQYVSSPEESRAINNVDRAIVIAGSGMLTGGRIVHHLRHNLWKENTSLIFVGYQAAGSPGRLIVDGARRLRFFGEELSVRAKIYTINGFSAHADQNDLLKWCGYFKNNPTFLITHGEERSAQALAEALKLQGKRSIVPELGASIDLDQKAVSVPTRPRVEKLDLLKELAERIALMREMETPLHEHAESYLQSALVLLDEAGKG
ncbi:MAG TPA: MBL fold metallo-hydrolase [Atribacteraceae bacterium]|nr:MBL fold metallo-hydrolase [Atribacteraceae bacterium]